MSAPVKSLLPPTFWTMESPLDDFEDEEPFPGVAVTDTSIFDGDLTPNMKELSVASAVKSSPLTTKPKRLTGSARRVRTKRIEEAPKILDTVVLPPPAIHPAAKHVVYKTRLVSTRLKKNDPVSLFASHQAQWKQQERMAARRQRALRQQQQPAY